MKKVVLLALMLTYFSTFAFSQNIEGVPLGQILSEDFIKKKFGANYTISTQPEYHYREINMGQGDSFLKGRINSNLQSLREFIFDQDTLVLDSRNRLVMASLHSNRYTIDKTHTFQGYHVGDIFCEKKLSRCGIIHHQNNESIIHIADKEDITTIEKLVLDKGIISSVQLLFSFGDDIENIGINELVLKREIRKKFGTPLKITRYETADCIASKYTFVNNGIESYLVISKRGRLLKYEVNSPKYKAFTQTIPDGISVGDKIEKASPLFNAEGIYRLLDNSYDRPFLTVEDGKITSIGYWRLD